MPVLLAALALAVALIAGALPARAAQVTTQNACHYSYDGYWRNLDIGLGGEAPAAASAGRTITLEDQTLEATLPDWLAQYGFSFGLLQAGDNDLPVTGWVAVKGTNTEEGVQVHRFETVASTTITTSGGEFVSATPFTYEVPTWDTEWTTTGGTVELSQGPAGSIPSVPAGRDGAPITPKGSLLLHIELGSAFLNLDCLPGGYTQQGGNYEETAAEPFASVDVPAQQCIAAPNGGAYGDEVVPTALTFSPGRAPFVLEGRTLSFAPSVAASVSKETLRALYADGQLLNQDEVADDAKVVVDADAGTTAGRNVNPLAARAAVTATGATASEAILSTADSATWTVMVMDPTPGDRTNGDETFYSSGRGGAAPGGDALSVSASLAATTWTPSGTAPVVFSLAAPGQIPAVPVGGGDEVLPYGSLYMHLGGAGDGLAYDCVAGGVSIADDGVPFDPAGRDASAGRYEITPVDRVVSTVPVKPLGTYQCISGLGRYAGREIEPLELTVTGIQGVTLLGDPYKMSPSLRVSLPLDLLRNLYTDSHNLIDGSPEGTINRFPAFAWLKLIGTNTVEGSQLLGTSDATWAVAVVDPTPESRANGDETFRSVSNGGGLGSVVTSSMNVTVSLGTASWTPTGGPMEFSIAPAGQLDDLPVLGKGYADTPYEVDAYGSVFFRAETNRYGANLDCVRGDVQIADPDIPYSNLGRGDPTTSPASGSTGRYELLEEPATPVGTVAVQPKAAFQCVSGLGRYAGREIQPLEIGLSPGSAPTTVAKGGTYTLSGARLVGTLPHDLLQRMYTDSHNLIDNGSNEFPAFAWVTIQGAGTAEGTQNVAVQTTWSVQVSDPTPGTRGNGDETIDPVTLSVELPATTWTATGDTAPAFSVGPAGRLDDLQVLGKGYADTPYEVDAYGSIFLRAETNRYGGNLDCVHGDVAIADASIPYSNLGRGDPTTDPASGSTGRYALSETPSEPFLTLSFASEADGAGEGTTPTGGGSTEAPGAGQSPSSPLYATAPAIAGGSSSSEKVTLSARQLLVNQRISQAAIRRLNAIDAWLDAGIEARDIAGAALGADELGAGITLGTAPGRTYAPASPRPLVIATASRSTSGKVTPTVRQLGINQRISQAAVRRANALATRLAGRLTGGDVKDGTLGGNVLAPSVGIAGLGSVASPPAKSITALASATGTDAGAIRLSAAQLRVNQRISQAAVRRANVLRTTIAKGLDGSAFADGSITALDFSSDAR